MQAVAVPKKAPASTSEGKWLPAYILSNPVANASAAYQYQYFLTSINITVHTEKAALVWPEGKEFLCTVS